MTGQVKEEILTRRVELGISIKNGCIQFIPEMIQSREFSKESTSIFLHVRWFLEKTSHFSLLICIHVLPNSNYL